MQTPAIPFREMVVNQASRSSRSPRATRIRTALVAVALLGLGFGPSWPAGAQGYPRVWSPAFPPHQPTQQHSYAMAYDEARQAVVLFGGYDGNTDGIYASTWIWNGQDWSMATLLGPGPRLGPMMAYDSRRQVCVLFGGEPPFEDAVAETWEWDGTTWRLRATNGPPASTEHAMAYDKSRGRVVLFGGTPCGLCGAHTGYTWEWDGDQWFRVATNGPPRRFGATMAYNEVRREMILFGGYDPGVNTVYDDTWTWDGTTWTQRPVTGPTATYDHAMAYDGGRQTVVLFGGFGSNSDRTWEWDGTAWSFRPLFPSPSGRAEFGMVYDAARDELVLYGGFAAGYPHDTWRLRWAETWVDFAYPGLPIFPEFGTFDSPFNTLGEGVSAAIAGSIVQIKSGSRNEPIHIGKAVRLRAYGGPVTIGP